MQLRSILKAYRANMSGIEDSRISTNPEQGLVDPQSGAIGNLGAAADRHQPTLSYHSDLPTLHGVSSIQW